MLTGSYYQTFTGAALTFSGRIKSQSITVAIARRYMNWSIVLCRIWLNRGQVFGNYHSRKEKKKTRLNLQIVFVFFFVFLPTLALLI